MFLRAPQTQHPTQDDEERKKERTEREGGRKTG
jgi:hypothetical protein